MCRKDGKTGEKWSRTDTDGVAKQYNLQTKVSDYDPLIFYFGMNYAYAIHYGVDRGISEYIDLAYDEIHDCNICIKHKIEELFNK